MVMRYMQDSLDSLSYWLDALAVASVRLGTKLKFEDLNDTIPYVMGGKLKAYRYSPYPNIILAAPGRHAKETLPKGGDYVVMVTDPSIKIDQFKHKDIFEDVSRRRLSSAVQDRDLMESYLAVVRGDDPDSLSEPGTLLGGTMDRRVFLQAVQCLAIAEHRRYAQHEAKFGGRYLPFRFAAGINESLWEVEDALSLEKKGRPGVEILEKEHGVPKLTQELFDGTKA
jgi:hypothetical protein